MAEIDPETLDLARKIADAVRAYLYAARWLHPGDATEDVIAPLLAEARREWERDHECSWIKTCRDAEERAEKAEADLAAAREEREWLNAQIKAALANCHAYLDRAEKAEAALADAKREATYYTAAFEAAIKSKHAAHAPQDETPSPEQELHHLTRCSMPGCERCQHTLFPPPPERHGFVEHPTPHFGCGFYEGGNPDEAWACCGKPESDPVHALAPSPERESHEERAWQAVDPNVRRWIINILLHPMASGTFAHFFGRYPAIKSEREFEERQQAARAAINLLAVGLGYALELDKPEVPPPATEAGDRVSAIYQHAKTIMRLTEIWPTPLPKPSTPPSEER